MFVESKDGTRVPVFITHHNGLRKDGANPTMLYGFGGFGLSEAPRFRPEVIAFLERGGVYATANIRGGGEYGQTWHDAGTFEKKQNVFDDFIAAAEYLVREKYASPQTLGIMGGSNGGLLVGAVMEQRPELIAVALLGAAVLDMLRFTASPAARWERGIRLRGQPDGVCLPVRVLAAAQRPARHVLPGDAHHDSGSRRSCRAEPFVQVRRDAPGGPGMRQPGAHSHRDAGIARLSADRQADRRTRRRVGVCAGAHESHGRPPLRHVERAQTQRAIS